MYGDTKYINTPSIQCCLILWPSYYSSCFWIKLALWSLHYHFHQNLATKQKKEHHFFKKGKVNSDSDTFQNSLDIDGSREKTELIFWKYFNLTQSGIRHASTVACVCSQPFFVWITNARVHAKLVKLKLITICLCANIWQNFILRKGSLSESIQN